MKDLHADTVLMKEKMERLPRVVVQAVPKTVFLVKKNQKPDIQKKVQIQYHFKFGAKI